MDDYPNTSEDPTVRRQFAENIFQILRPLSASEMPRSCPVDGESSECSALSDPFSDLDESYVLLDQRKKKPGVDETDELLLMNQFTPEFRSAYDELAGQEPLSARSPEQPIPCQTCQDDPAAGFSPKFRSFIDEMLRKCDLQHHQEEKRRREQQQAQQRKKQGRVRTVVSEESFCPVETDSLSGIWRMLDAVSENEQELFTTTGPHYDLYYDRRFAWMTRDEIAWDQIEASKKKCEQWLKFPCQMPEESSRPK
ncbi:uncharacterized protein LOC131285594 [Anopheles ziemanni]|uniref:uncharacterized protein LOC131267455 n=1 Tax=Anopheles coustani TaxID=139045 RepID=UPI002659AD00|nr:uncharacterized protein LOC131267455 [Anopheles coustani]XP_058170436.1 uncharacterized protein LOC131285594 [Anopheles ziemanni]